MGKHRLPDSAFGLYVSLGAERSYQRVADEYGVSKRWVTKVAGREGWAQRLERVQRETKKRTDEHAVDALMEMNERHTSQAKELQEKAIKALRRLPISTARDVIRALELGVKQERLVLGEPTERQANVEEVIRKEYERWLGGDDEPDSDDLE